MKKVAVILPTFNEAKNIEKSINDVLDQGKNLPGWQIDIVVADSNSPDKTREVAQKLAAKNPLIHYLSVERGLGVGLIKGHKYALENIKPDILAQLDADGQVEPDVLVRLVKAIEDGFDLALGSRFVKGGKNNLSLSRRLFSAGSSWICRVLMGPLNIKEFTNSARAFTPALFSRMNLSRLPWREKTFIVQPAFLNEAILAGAKYKEVPLVFKNRAEGYSKNKVVNYTYDVVTYTLDAALHRLGVNLPLFQASRRAKTIIKFCLVGLSGTVVDFIFYNLFISNFGIRPATAKGFSTEVAIINNFTFNHLWTFRHRKTKSSVWQKFLIFNGVSLGGLAISVFIVKFLHLAYGDGVAHILGLDIAYYNLFFFATIPPVLVWNFTVNHLVTWRNKPAPS